MTLLNYWPTSEEINNCIKAEAETSEESLILAVHQPMLISKINSNDIVENKNCSEEDILKYFLSKNLSEGFILVPITGVSGIGKSHAIRWLNSKLNQINLKKNKYHIIRIPKSASLRNVVERIFEPLKNTPEYENIYNDFHKATGEISDENCVINFRAGLESAILEYKVGLDRKTEMIKIGHCQKLPSLFSDDALRVHFDKILLRIVKRALKGKNINSKEDEFPQFYENDFILPDSVNNSSEGVKKYCFTRLQTPEYRQEVVDILNDIIDNAIKRTFKLHESLGSKTLQDIILDVRKYLLQQDKELLLLVEDFAALSGVQETLLNICIQSAFEDGIQKYCFMRTAIALTDGHLSGRETILTRAKYKWKVKSKLDEEMSIYPQVINLVGAYLNVSRFGKNKILRMFNDNKDTTVEIYRDENISAEEEDILNQFGTSKQNFHLFPYNNKFIIALTNKHLKIGNEFIYNPRLVINHILRNFLLEHRDSFIDGDFPNIDGFSVKIDIDPIIKNKVNRGDIKKYTSFISLWGGNPENEEQLKGINHLLYKGFNLKPLTEFKEIEKPPITNQNKSEFVLPINIVSQSQVIEPKVDKWKEWKDKLDRWYEGESLSQGDANIIRKEIRDSIVNYIDWSKFYIRKTNFRHEGIWLPGIKTRNSNLLESSILIKIADSVKEEFLRNSILAVIRYTENKYSFDYDEGCEDILYFVPFIEKLANQVCLKLREKYNKDIKPLVQFLVHTSILLGYGDYNLNKDNIPRLISNILIEVEVEEKKFQKFQKIKPIELDIYDSWNQNEKDKIQNWNNYRDFYYKIYLKFQNLLFDRFGCFQGESGKTLLSINHIILKNALRDANIFEFNKENISQYLKLALNEEVDNKVIGDYFSRELNQTITISQTLRIILINWKNKIDSFLGEDFDKNALNELLKMTISKIEKQGSIFPQSFDINNIKKFRSDFNQISIKEMLDIAKEVENEEIFKFKLLSLVTKFDSKTYETSIKFVETFDKFFENVEKNVNNKLSQLEQYNPEPVKNKIKDNFTQISSSIKFLEEN